MAFPDSTVPVSRAHLGAWRTFRSYWAGNTLSAVGDYFTIVALPIAALNLTDSGAWVAAVEFAELTAVLIMGMWLAGIADRSHARPVMAITAGTRGVVVGGLAVWFWLGSPPIGAIVAAGFVLGALRHLHIGAENVMISAVVPENLIGRAGSRMELSEGVGNFVGALAGGVVATISVGLAFGIDAVTFAIALLAIFSMGHFVIDRSTDADPAADATGGTDDAGIRPTRSFGVAIKALRQENHYWRMLVATAITTLASVCLLGQWVTLARRDLGLSGWQIGLGMALVGAGNIAGSLACDRFGWVTAKALAPSLVIFGGAPLAIGLSRSWVVAMPSLFLAGAGIAVAAVVLQTHRNSRFDTGVQARVYSIHRITIDSLVLPGVLVGGLLADRIGSSEMFVVFGAIALVGPVVAIMLGAASASEREAIDLRETSAPPTPPIPTVPIVPTQTVPTQTMPTPAQLDLTETVDLTEPVRSNQIDEVDVFATIAEGLRNSRRD